MWRTLFFCVFALPLLAAEEAPPTKLDLELIHSKYYFSPQSPGSASWVEGQDSLLAVEPSKDVEDGTDLVRYDVETGDRTIILGADKLALGEGKDPLTIDDFTYGPKNRKMLIFTNSKKVWRYNTKGEYWVIDLKTFEKVQIAPDFEASSLMFAKFSPDASQVGFVYKHNIYTQNLSNGKIRQLTTDGTDLLINGTFDWVYEEEFGLRDGFRWSPDGKSIAFWQLDAEGVGTFYMINNTDDVYAKTIPLQYPKAGTTNSSCRTGVIDLASGDVTWMKIEGDPRQNYIASLEWIPTGEGLVMQYLNRKQNHLQLLRGNPKTGETNLIHEEHETAWLDVVSDMHWIEGGKYFTWTSERDGFRRLYLYDLSGKLIRPLTPAGSEMINLNSISEKTGQLYYIASPDNPLQRYLYRASLDGKGKPERISPADSPGTHSYRISPDQKWAIHTYNNFTTPSLHRIVTLPEHKEVRVLQDNARLKERLSHLTLGSHEFLRVDIGDVELDAWMIKPPNFDPNKKYPILFYVYGEPAGQTVRDRFGSGALWHYYMAQEGYIVCSVDNRGANSPRGRDWRKSIYQKIGTQTSADQAAAAKIIVSRPYIDENNVAIWGWSGGGSQTLNAMFRYSDIYQTGMAVAAVADMRYYDTIYQERYTGIPQESPEAYEQGSPITFAEGLKGNLLVIHGTGDDNVHYQCMEALVDKLIAHNKHFTMMAYPNRAHGIFRGKNTRLHLYSLMTRYMKEHHKPGPY